MVQSDTGILNTADEVLDSENDHEGEELNEGAK